MFVDAAPKVSLLKVRKIELSRIVTRKGKEDKQKKVKSKKGKVKIETVESQNEQVVSSNIQNPSQERHTKLSYRVCFLGDFASLREPKCVISCFGDSLEEYGRRLLNADCCPLLTDNSYLIFSHCQELSSLLIFPLSQKFARSEFSPYHFFTSNLSIRNYQFCARGASA